MNLMNNRNKLYLAIIIVIALIIIAFFNLRQSAEQASQNQPLPDTSFGEIETDFPEEYITANRQRVQVILPRVYELMHVVVSLTDPGQAGKYNLSYGSDYYKKVMDRFRQYEDHPAVKEYVKLRQEYSYSGLRKIFTYRFEGEEIVRDEIYNYSNTDLKNYAELLEDFARQSKFNDFYDEHEIYYQAKIEEFKDYTDLKSIWNWLEENYPNRYDSYKVVLSPLVFGSHNTTNFMDEEKDFKEIVMFVSTADLFTGRDLASEALTSSLIERMVFTEIDHNYVNPVTDQEANMRKIMEVFKDLEKWNQQNGYERSGLTFNEYMTWATACLYIYDTYDKEVYNQFLNHTNETMQWRGFIKFEEFYDELLQLYKSSDKPIYELYPEILKRASEI